MIVSQESKSVMALFKILQKLGMLDKAEEFDRFYIWVREVEHYAETYSNAE